MSLGFKFFENTPINNVGEYSDTSQDKIVFRLPPVPGQLVNNHDLVLNGTIQINTDSTTPYNKPANGGISNVAISCDTVVGVDNFFDKQDINNLTYNTVLEQAQNIGLYQKIKRSGSQSKNDLMTGYFSNNDICAPTTQLLRQHLCRSTLATDGVPFSINLANPLIANSYSSGIETDTMGGLIITISLNTITQAIFNIFNDPADPTLDLLTADANYTIKNVKLFGRAFQLAEPTGQNYVYRTYNNILQTLQTNNESVSFEPMSQQVHNIVAVFQPNNYTRNNFNNNAVNADELVGLKQYKVGLSGVNLPYDFDIDNVTDLENYVLTAGDYTAYDEVGSAENILHLIASLRTRYRPCHSLINSENEVSSYNDLYNNQRLETLNMRGIGINYSFNFAGFTTNMRNQQFQLQVQSLINQSTTKGLPDYWENTSFVGNFFVSANKMVNTKNFQISS